MKEITRLFPNSKKHKLFVITREYCNAFSPIRKITKIVTYDDVFLVKLINRTIVSFYSDDYLTIFRDGDDKPIEFYGVSFGTKEIQETGDFLVDIMSVYGSLTHIVTTSKKLAVEYLKTEILEKIITERGVNIPFINQSTMAPSYAEIYKRSINIIKETI